VKGRLVTYIQGSSPVWFDKSYLQAVNKFW